jgi:hypothetical protein
MSRARSRVVRHAKELVVASATFAASCRHHEIEPPQNPGYDPAPEPCHVTAQPVEVTGYWITVDGQRGVLLDRLPETLAADGLRPILGGYFVVPQDGVLLTRRDGRFSGDCDRVAVESVELPADPGGDGSSKPFTLRFP